ncbi:PREDICTED: uncharacterized protein LOC106820227, partial [Priapulus caudatus]|uniref:Uncharacterized protein LOC106820227 n=1 Tax=Priapulus caudatus TaxID=37621 RepID=A0ABM1F728_PRICU
MLCQYLLRDEVAGDDVYLERFAKDFLPSLLALSTDAVPNVRLALARALTQSVLPIEFMTSPKNPHCDDISRVLSLLRSDKDIDVQHYSSQPPGHCLPLPLLQPVSLASPRLASRVSRLSVS